MLTNATEMKDACQSQQRRMISIHEQTLAQRRGLSAFYPLCCDVTRAVAGVPGYRQPCQTSIAKIIRLKWDPRGLATDA